MHGEQDVAVFLVALAILLGVARVLGELCRSLRLPAVTGELAAGVLLGPTVLGRIAPEWEHAIFARTGSLPMLGGYTVLASVLLLTIAGLEIDLSVVWSRRRAALATGVAGIALPLVLGTALGMVLPASQLEDPSRRIVFALFVGTALSISAMPVIARTLLDLGLFRTDLGVLIMAAAIVNDLVGWLMFSLLAGPLQGRAIGWGALAMRTAAVLAFVTFALLVGRRLFDRLLAILERDRMSAAGRVLSLVMVVAVLGGALAQKIGVHAAFGAFVVGVTIGDSPRLRAETRARVHEFVTNVFAPVFFAAVGLRVDFVHAFDPGIVAAVFVVACVAKIVGCSIGARWAGLPSRDAWAVGFAMNSRGAMEIILAVAALEFGLIRPPLFVALVIMALGTSLLAGPAMARLLRTRASTDVRALLDEGAVVLTMRARTAEQAVRELAGALAVGTPLDPSVLTEAVLDAEAGMLGGLGGGVALPHARLRGIARPLLALGVAADGVDFNAPDGEPARIVFLLFVPEAMADRSVDLHAAIVRVVTREDSRNAILHAGTRAEALGAVANATSTRTKATQTFPGIDPA